MPKKDLMGQRFGRLVVIDAAPSRKGKAYWLCKCDCGIIKEVSSLCLVNGLSKSCGCYKTEITKARCSTNCSKNKPLYRVFGSMKARCYNKNNKAYKEYGGRGITICQEWLDSYDSFYYWAIENGYKKGLQIDRIDFNKGYSPENCRWVDIITQANNKRNVKKYEINNETKSIPEWCREYNMEYSVVKQRVDVLHWDLQKALTTPKKILCKREK